MTARKNFLFYCRANFKLHLSETSKKILEDSFSITLTFYVIQKVVTFTEQ